MKKTTVPLEQQDTLEISPQNTVTEKKQQNILDIIRRQTDYSDDMIKSKLSEHNNDIMSVIREYMNNGKKKSSIKKPKTKTTNQMVFSEIRKLMDDDSQSYRRKKELEENKN